MRTLLDLSESTIAMLILKWTLLLGLAWTLDILLRGRHARWRLVLWRSALVIGLGLPLATMLEVPAWEVALPSPAPTTAALGSEPDAAVAGSQQITGGTESMPNVGVLVSDEFAEVTSPRPTRHWLFAGWAAGFLLCAASLLRLHWQLGGLRKKTIPAPSAVIELASEIRQELELRTGVTLCLSDTARSPFLCGLFKPTIVVPRVLVEELDDCNLRAVLRHEMAHLRGNDLPWCVAWRWIAALLWFHPLAWQAPAAHKLACEEEADRIAAGGIQGQEKYARALAQLALRTVAVPAVETQLTLNGASQIVRRLKQLQSGALGEWRWQNTVAAFSLAGVLMILTAGWEFTQAKAADEPEPGARGWKEAVIIVKDDEGKPIPGATLEPYSFRVKGVDAASAHNWRSIAERRPHKADAQGKVSLRYPVVAIPEEKQVTSKISLIASHPDFATKTTEISVDDPQSEIQLARGVSLEVSGYFGSERQPVYEIAANLSGDPSPRWKEVRKGVWKCRQLAAREYILQLTGKLPSGEIVYSEARPIATKAGETQNLQIELKRGIRLEGRIDNRVARPIRNGRVIVTVRPKEFPNLPVVEDYYKAQERYGSFNFWSSYRAISDEGTFVFESLPAGEVDVIVHGDGFISRNGPEMKNRINGQINGGPPFGFPQAFALNAPMTKIEVATEPTATLRVTTKRESAEPIEGAAIYLNPNVMRIGTGIFGSLPKPGEEPFQEIDVLPEINYSAWTDENGVAVLKNVPAFLTTLDIEHPEFQVPLGTRHGRSVRFKLAPGETQRIEVILQPKGTEFIGEIKRAE